MKTKFLLLALLAQLCVLSASAYDAEIDGIYYNFSGSEATVAGYSGNMDAVVIPSSVVSGGSTYTVTAIGRAAFNSCKMTSLMVPATVTSIGDNAFCYCSNLSDLTIPSGVKAIEPYTFFCCYSLKAITIPEGVTSIGNGAFDACEGLAYVTIPSSVTSIGNGAFDGCYFMPSNFVNNSTLTSSDNWGATMCDESPNDELVIKDGVLLKCRLWASSDIIIPNNVTAIGDGAFRLCNPTSVIIPESVTSIGSSAFSHCSGLTSITIPNSVTSIGDEAFYYCYKLTSLVVPGSVKSIGNAAFSGCDLESLTLEEGIVTIGDEAFRGNYQLTSLTIPNSVTTIGREAFQGCSSISSVTVGDNVQSIGYDAFYKYASLYVRRGTDALLTLWECGLRAYDMETEEFLDKPRMGETVKTQTTIIFFVYNLYPEFEYVFNQDFAQVSGSWLKLAGLCPNTEYTLVLDVKSPNKCLTLTRSATTRPVEMEVDRKKVTNLTISAVGYYDAGDAEVTESGFEGIGVGDECSVTGLAPGERHEFVYYVVVSDKYTLRKPVWYETIPIEASASCEVGASSCLLTGELQGVIDATVTDFGFDGYPGQTDVKLTGLDPETQYTKTFHVTTQEGGTVQTDVSFTTEPLTLATLMPRVISEGNVIVCATSNLDDEEANVGFEWRRTDWTDDFDSKSGGAYLYEGTMEGYIRSLNSNYLWKFRPYYTSNAGNTYYGEWKGMDPSDYSYFEPTVYTYATISVTGNRAEVKGYAMRGTDRVTSQGFMYWKNTSSYSLRKKAPSIPSDAVTVEVSGNIMTTALEDLDYETTYCYVAFVRTEENETFFGEVQTFSTSFDPDGIEGVKADTEVTEVARYDLQGRRLSQPQNGLNIIRYSDGSSRKVWIK